MACLVIVPSPLANTCRTVLQYSLDCVYSTVLYYNITDHR